MQLQHDSQCDCNFIEIIIKVVIKGDRSLLFDYFTNLEESSKQLFYVNTLIPNSLSLFNNCSLAVVSTKFRT
jgi:hypothetical protein